MLNRYTELSSIAHRRFRILYYIKSFRQKKVHFLENGSFY